MAELRAGLIGEHISRTRFPKALEIMCAEVGWMLEFQLLETADDAEFDFDATIDMIRQEGWTGVTVTHPWKRHARAFAEEGMCENVAHLGASNTLVFEDDVTGYNTDFTGFLSSFKEAGFVPGDVVMIGAGGVAEALAPALMTLGARSLRIADLDQIRASALARKCGAELIAMDQVTAASKTVHGLVNATPLGMKEYPGSAFQAVELGAQSWAFDAVYTPTDTAFLIAAEKAGLRTLTGFELFRHMAVRSFEAYTGLAFDPADILPKLEVLRP